MTLKQHLQNLATEIGWKLVWWGEDISRSPSPSPPSRSGSPSYSNSRPPSPSPSEEITDYDHYKATEIMSTVGRNDNF